MRRVLALALLLPVAQVHAQPSEIMRPDTRVRWPALLIGSGLAAANSASASLATNAGGLFIAAVQMPLRHTTQPARLMLRAEGMWSHQSLATDANSGLSGDVQTLSAALLLRVAPFVSATPSSSRVTPYLLAGAGVSRPSTRMSVFINNPDMPSARFGQTSSEVAPTALGGVGAQLRVGRAQLFAEARTQFARLDAGTRRASFGTLGLVFQPGR